MTRDDFALQNNKRKLKMCIAKTAKDPDYKTSALLALSNLQKGDVFRFYERTYQVISVTDKNVIFNVDGKRKLINPDSLKAQNFLRDVEGLLLGRFHGVDAGDLKTAIERDPAIQHETIVENALSEGKVVPPEVIADYPEFGKK